MFHVTHRQFAQWAGCPWIRSAIEHYNKWFHLYLSQYLWLQRLVDKISSQALFFTVITFQKTKRLIQIVTSHQRDRDSSYWPKSWGFLLDSVPTLAIFPIDFKSEMWLNNGFCIKHVGSNMKCSEKEDSYHFMLSVS